MSGDNDAEVTALNKQLKGHRSYVIGTLIPGFAKNKQRLISAITEGGGVAEYDRVVKDGTRLSDQRENIIMKFTRLTSELLQETETDAIATATTHKDDVVTKIDDALDELHAVSMQWFHELRRREEQEESPEERRSSRSSSGTDGATYFASALPLAGDCRL